MSRGDAAEQLWSRVVRLADEADQAVLGRAADCVALGVAEMVVNARKERWRNAALRLAPEPGPATVVGAGRSTDVASAVAANALLMHANLADDTYLTACHPGVTVLPTALAVAESAGRIGGDRWLRAIVGGYECAGALAAAMLPEASRRGWRVTAAVAPFAAATVAVLLGDERAAGPAALRLAASVAGGPLAVFGEGDGWRLQPALAAVQGVHAARAAVAGLEGDTATLGAALELLAGGETPLAQGRGPAILDVTFKRFPVPMYGQAVWASFEDASLDGEIVALRIRVPTFAAAYADQSPTSATSVQAIALAGLRAGAPRAVPPSLSLVEVIGDDAVGPHGAEIEVVLRDGSVRRLRGDGDTSGWSSADAEDWCCRLIGTEGAALAAAAHELRSSHTVEPLLELVRALR